MRFFLFVVVILSFISCTSRDNGEKLESKYIFNLNQLDFSRDPGDILGANLDSSAKSQHYMVEKGYANAFDYPLDYKSEPWNDTLSLYGKTFYSKVVDSIAHFDDIYFNKLAFLLHDKKIVAVLAEGVFSSDFAYLNLEKKLRKLYGEPTFSPVTDQDVFCEWQNNDAYFQIDYSKRYEVIAMSNKPMESKETFNVSFLIYNKNEADKINKMQMENYHKTGVYKVLAGDFKIYSFDPAINLILANELLFEKFGDK